MFEYFDKDKMKIPANIWLKDISEMEPGCLVQLQNLTNLPFAVDHLGMMPDCHLGYGMPIGGVLATDGVIVPNAVGVDIGCGMSFMLTNIHWSEISSATTKDGQEIRKAILSTITRNIPVGFNHHKDDQEWVGWEQAPLHIPLIAQEINSAKKQLGTLGGGNHFIELQQDQNGFLAIMIHSGSRNFGKLMCDEYNAQAIALNAFPEVPKEYDLAGLPIDSKQGKEYFEAMDYALRFAEMSRTLMMNRASNVLFNMIEKYVGLTGVEITKIVDCHHNYAAVENHCGKDVIVHRKGAVRAAEDDIVIVPGSMGTASYVGLGRGNAASFNSCSHGSGRCIGRKEAKRRHSTQSVVEFMKQIDVVVLKSKKEDIAEECSWAYKDIDDVITKESDLIQTTHKLTPLGVIKA